MIMNLTATVFFPSDIDRHDATEICYCYGWTQPSICVAGVIDAQTEDGAARVLSMQIKTGLDQPVVLGLCTFDAAHHPKLAFLKEYNIVYYERHAPNSLRFYSLDELRLDAVQPVQKSLSSIHYPIFNSKPVSCGIDDRSIKQFNTSMSLAVILSQPAESQLNNLPHPRRLIYSLGAAVHNILKTPVSQISTSLIALCGTRIPFTATLTLRDVSNTLLQVDLRAEQATFLVNNLHTLSHRDETPISIFAAHYTNFFNTVWLILNDITLGVAFGSFICENSEVLARMMESAFESILVVWIQWVLKWLDSWPAGLKLNTELSRVYSHTFVDLVSLWAESLLLASPYLPRILYLIGITSSFGGGLTLAVSLISDLFALLTLHLYVCYIISNAVYARVLSTGGSLFNLFRGKRYNVLRNRTDSWEYDMDQLLFGTILFTLLTFLFPTVLAYYALFGVIRLLAILFHFALETLLAFMNHFPLFALMVRIKDPGRLPGGVYFQFAKHNREVLCIKSQPISFSSIFFQYIYLWSRLSWHYNPLRLLRCLVTGEFLKPIARYAIRYSNVDWEGDTRRRGL